MKLTGESKLLLGILAATVPIVAGAAFFLNRPPAPPLPRMREELVAPDAFTIGSASASAYLVEFSDFQCPACKAFQPTVEDIVHTYKEKLLFVYRHYPLSQHQYATSAALAAEAAGKQGKFWEMSKLLFEHQDRFPSNPWGELADKLNLDRAAFDADFSSQALKEKIDRDKTVAIRLGLAGTPSFFLNGFLLRVASPQDLKKAVADALP